MVSADVVFKAIAHPARRQILALLASEACSVKELTSAFTISQPAISQHLKELREADLVASERMGLEQRYRLTPSPLQYVIQWSDQYRNLIDPQGHAWMLVSTRKQRSAPQQNRNRQRRTKDGR